MEDKVEVTHKINIIGGEDEPLKEGELFKKKKKKKDSYIPTNENDVEGLTYITED